MHCRVIFEGFLSNYEQSDGKYFVRSAKENMVLKLDSAEWTRSPVTGAPLHATICIGSRNLPGNTAVVRDSSGSGACRIGVLKAT